MKVGFFGTGAFAQEHARSLQNIGAEIAACCGTNPAKTKTFAGKYGARVFDHPDEMIHPAIIDALYLVVPPYALDGKLEQSSLDQGIPFFCEKPVGLDLAVCRNTARQVEATGLVTACGYILRHGNAAAAMKTVIARNRISIIRAGRMENLHGPVWRRSMEKSGGGMVDLGTHQVDLLRWLLGEIQSVAALATSGICRDRFENCDIYDSMDSQILFQSGVIGDIAISCILENQAKKTDLLNVFGRDFMLTFDFCQVRYKEGAADWVELTVEPDRMDIENRNFLEAVEQRDPRRVLSSYPDAVKTLAVTLAMNQSAAKMGERIQMSFS